MYSANGNFYNKSNIIENFVDDNTETPLPTNMKIVITTNLINNTKSWGYRDNMTQEGTYEYLLKTFQPSFDIKKFFDLTKYDQVTKNNLTKNEYDGLKHDYKTININFTLNSIQNNKIIFNFRTNTRFSITYKDNDREYKFRSIIGDPNPEYISNVIDDTNYITNSQIKDHSIVINRNNSKFNNNNNNNVKIEIRLSKFYDNHEFKITNFGDVINKLK